MFTEASRRLWALEMFPTADELSDLAAACVTCKALKWGYAPAGETREQRIADAARHIREQRKAEEEKWDRYRENAELLARHLYHRLSAETGIDEFS